MSNLVYIFFKISSLLAIMTLLSSRFKPKNVGTSILTTTIYVSNTLLIFLYIVAETKLNCEGRSSRLSTRAPVSFNVIAFLGCHFRTFKGRKMSTSPERSDHVHNEKGNYNLTVLCFYDYILIIACHRNCHFAEFHCMRLFFLRERYSSSIRHSASALNRSSNPPGNAQKITVPGG